LKYNHIMTPFKKITHKLSKILKVMGPGLITGASDDDPSGIATYSQAGAGFGLTTLWMTCFTFPMLANIQGMCARIGLVTQKGLTGTLKTYYPKWILYFVLLLSFPAIVLNIGADIQGMGAVSNMLIPQVPIYVFSLGITVILIFVIIKFDYKKIAGILKWLCVVMLVYFIVPLMIKINWMDVLKNTVIPTIIFNKDFIATMVAILGTTISPYLFFWQATMEAEEFIHDPKKVIVNKRILKDMRNDVNIGMFFSHLVMYFIILTTGVVLFNAGIHKIDTVDQAAKALEPLAGQFAYLLFAIGVLGTGLLAIPVLAGSISYMMAETFNWQEGLDKKFYEARPFYITMITAMGVGLLLNFIGVSPIQSLIYTAILYGLTAPILIGVILHICNNKAVMKEYTNNKIQNIVGFITLILMTAAAVVMIYLELS